MAYSDFQTYLKEIPTQYDSVFGRHKEEVESNSRKQMAWVESKGLLNYDIDPRANFHLDRSKISFHPERANIWKQAWERGETPPMPEERIAPITIDMALTQKCSVACKFCYAGLQYNDESPLDFEVYERFLDDCVEIGHRPGEGVKAISLVSDGESTENPYFTRFVISGKERGIDMASGTNGWKISKEDMPYLVRDLTYFRFNMNGGDVKANSEIMGMTAKASEEVRDNIREVVRLKKELNSNVNLGLQMVLMPEYADQVIPLALLGKELGVDYTVIKHCSDDEDGRLGVDYVWYKQKFAEDLLKTAEALSTPEYSVQAKWSKLKTGRDRKYSKCFGTPLHLQFSGTGLVAPCGSFFNERYTDKHIGHLKDERFKDLWASEKYWSIIGNLGSKNFDPRYECETLCLQDKTNEVLFDWVENGMDFPDSTGLKEPIGVNFI
jgi:MoaA/NifB/PqqE/SkfB family radical SAM enzyme